MTAIKTEPESGFLSAPAAIDARVRIFAYQKLDKLPRLYVPVGVEQSDVIRAWLIAMGSHLILGLPATLPLVGARHLRAAAHRTAAAGGHSPGGDRAGAAPGPEDGGRRPPDGRHRARLQQPADRDPRQSRAARAVSTGPIRVSGVAKARQAPSAPPRWCQRLLAFSASRCTRCRGGSISTGWSGHSGSAAPLDRRDVTIETVLAGGMEHADRSGPGRERHYQPAVNARDAMPDGGTPDDRDAQLRSRRSLCCRGASDSRRPVRDCSR